MESLFEKKELHDSVLGIESVSDSLPESHSMEGNVSGPWSNVRTKSSFARLFPCILPRRPSLAIKSLCFECSRAFVAGRGELTRRVVSLFIVEATMLIL